MFNHNKTIRDRLLDIEAIHAERADKYQKEIQAMIDRKLTASRKVAHVVVIAFALASAIMCGWLAITEESLPPLGRTGLATGTLFGLAWAWYGFSILKRGAIDLKVHTRWAATMVWVFTLLMVVFFLMVAMTMNDKVIGILMVANGLVFLIGAAVYWLSYKIDDAQLSTREKLLQLELQIAELADRIKLPSE